jgi:hypothetical protein
MFAFVTVWLEQGDEHVGVLTLIGLVLEHCEEVFLGNGHLGCDLSGMLLVEDILDRQLLTSHKVDQMGHDGMDFTLRGLLEVFLDLGDVLVNLFKIVLGKGQLLVSSFEGDVELLDTDEAWLILGEIVNEKVH